jgi:peptidoglycan/LPS O-acetylase OafA/YrhL
MHLRANFRLKPESDEMLTLDAVRFLAASAVVVEHYWQALHGHEGIPGGDRMDFLSLAVDVFFIISGFVIATVYSDHVLSTRDYLRFMRKRIARLGPLHWATLSFFVSIGAILLITGHQSNFPDLYYWPCVVPHAMLLHAFDTCTTSTFNFPSWSISAEMAAYLAFPLFVLVSRHMRSMLIGISVLTLCVIYLMSGGPSGNEATGWTNWTIDFGAVRGLAGFSFGVALYAYRDGIRNSRAALPLLIFLIVVFVTLGLAGVPPMWLAPVAYAIAFLAIANDLHGEKSIIMRRLAPLGQLTYSGYMLHVPLRFVVVILIGERLLNLHGTSYTLWSIFAGLLVLPISWLSLVVFERPTRRWLSGPGMRAPAIVTVGSGQAALLLPEDGIMPGTSLDRE